MKFCSWKYQPADLSSDVYALGRGSGLGAHSHRKACSTKPPYHQALHSLDAHTDSKGRKQLTL